MGDEHQDVQRSERQRRHGQQVSSPQMVSMVAQEGAPTLTRRAPRPLPAVTSNRAIADRDAQLQQLTSDPLGTPQPVVAGHGHDELTLLGTEMRASAASGARLPAPE